MRFSDKRNINSAAARAQVMAEQWLQDFFKSLSGEWKGSLECVGELDGEMLTLPLSVLLKHDLRSRCLNGELEAKMATGEFRLAGQAAAYQSGNEIRAYLDDGRQNYHDLHFEISSLKTKGRSHAAWSSLTLQCHGFSSARACQNQWHFLLKKRSLHVRKSIELVSMNRGFETVLQATLLRT